MAFPDEDQVASDIEHGNKCMEAGQQADEDICLLGKESLTHLLSALNCFSFSKCIFKIIIDVCIPTMQGLYKMENT